MADIITYPENGITYDADDASGYLATRLSGVYSAEEDFSVTAQDGLSVQVSAGQAWVRPARFKGRSIIMEQPTTVVLTEADPVRSRIDRIVLRYDAAAKKTSLQVLDGTPDSAAPAAPEISRTELVYDLCLAEIKRPAGSTAVTTADITDTRADETVCGVMRDGVTGIPTGTLVRQWQAVIESMKGGSFYTRAEVDALLEQLKSVVGYAANTVPVWTSDLLPGYRQTLTAVPPDSVDYVVVKGPDEGDDAIPHYLFPGESHQPKKFISITFKADKTIECRNDAGSDYRFYLVGYHFETYTSGVKVPHLIGSRVIKNTTDTGSNVKSFTVSNEVDYVVIQWMEADVKHSLIRLRGSSGHYAFSQSGVITVPFTNTVYYTFYHYATPEELNSKLVAAESAQADADALNLDQDYRLTLLELGVTDDETTETT